MSPFDLRPTLSSALAELSMAALAEAAFGDVDLAAKPIASAVSHALDAPVLVLALDDLGGGERALVPTACVRVTPETESFPVAPLYANALLHDEPTVAPSLPPLSADGGVLARIGSRHDPLALLVALAPEGRVFDAEERVFLHAAASVLHARLALDRQRHELAESQDRARAVVETSVDGIITIDERGRIQTFNPGAARIFGYTAEEVRGENVHVLMPEPYHTEHDGYVQAYLDTGERRIIGIGREVTGRRKSGEVFPMDLAVSEVCLQDGDRLFVGLVRDISERRDLEREVLRIAEEERRRIGQDLHDGLGQTLTGIGLFARGLTRQLETEGSPSAEAARQVVSLMEEADAHARAIARSLVPVELEQNGLQAALERMAERARQLYDVDVRVEAVGTGHGEADALPPAAATHLFRIAQEALANAAQHGRAETVRVRLVRGEEQLRLRVEDDGVGFRESIRSGGALDREPATEPAPDPRPSVSAPARPADHRGMGLRIMHYRAHLAGGTLEIRPGAGRGTVVTCTVPL